MNNYYRAALSLLVVGIFSIGTAAMLEMQGDHSSTADYFGYAGVWVLALGLIVGIFGMGRGDRW